MSTIRIQCHIANSEIRIQSRSLTKRVVIVPTRGQQKDISHGTSHRVEIVRLYIERQTFTEIERRMEHSLTAIKRYIVTFSRVAYLAEKSYSIKEIAFLVWILHWKLIIVQWQLTDISVTLNVCVFVLRKGY